MPIKNSNNTVRLLLKELPYFGINLIPIHGQFHSCSIHPICNGSPKWWRSVTDRDGSTGSDVSSRIVTDCFDRHTGSHVAKRDSGSELEVVYTYPRKSWRIVTIRDKSLSWRGPRRSEAAREEPSQP